MPVQNHRNAARRVAAKRARLTLQEALTRLGPETVAKLRHVALQAATARLGANTDPFAVTREADRNLEAYARFLLDGGRP